MTTLRERNTEHAVRGQDNAFPARRIWGMSADQYGQNKTRI